MPPLLSIVLCISRLPLSRNRPQHSSCCMPFILGDIISKIIREETMGFFATPDVSDMNLRPSSSADRIVQALSLPMPLNDRRWSRDALNSRDKSPLQSLSMEDAISMALASRVPLFIRIARSSVLLKLSAPCATSLSRGLSLAHKSFIFIVQVYWGYSANSQSRVAWVQSRTFTLTKSPALCELSVHTHILF